MFIILEENSTNQPGMCLYFAEVQRLKQMILTLLCDSKISDTNPGVIKIRSEVHVCMPPLPIPIKTRLATSSAMFRERPQSRQPRANTVYAKSKQVLRPNISLSFP